MPKVRVKTVPTNLDRGTNMFKNNVITSPHESGWNNESGPAVSHTLSAVPREHSNLEAEKGERVITDLNRDGIPENYSIGGKKHYQGGTPLSLPDQSFIFSDDKKKLGIKDPKILKEFGIENEKAKKVYTPADIAKKYDLNNYKKILLDPNSTKMQVSTAEKMVSNYNVKLGKLALVQESIKGFPEGVPNIAMPYVATSGMDPAAFETLSSPMMKYGGTVRKYQMGGTVDATWSANYYARLQDAYDDHLQSFDLNEDDVSFQDYANNLEMYDSDIKQEATEYADKQSRKAVDFRKDIQIPGGAVYRPQQTQDNKIPSTSPKVTKSWNIPKDAVQINDQEQGWQDKARDAIKQGRQVYIKSGEGYKRVTGLKTPEGQYDSNDPRYKAMGEYAGEYAAMVNMVNSNPEFQDALYDKYKQEQKSSSNKTGVALSKEDMLKNFFDFQAQVYSIRNLPTSEQLDPRWDNADNKMYHEVSKKLGLTPLDPKNIANAQAAYAGLVGLSSDPKFSNIFSNYDVVPVGLGDEQFLGREDISPIDSDFGNTTQGQWFRPKSTDLALEDVQQQETITPGSSPIKPGIPQYAQPEAGADWWLQDIVKTAGAFGDANRIKKYLPWDRPLDAVIPDVTFYDPSRALAANSEQANIADQTLSSFAGAQGTSARVSQVQGQALANAANILGDYDNKNVAVANQYDNSVANIRNQVGAANREISKGLYDATTIANQQFDNSKAMARQGLRQSYIDAITNRAQTQALNSLYPQYNVDPMSGGFVNFTKGRQLNPSTMSGSSSNYQVDMNYLKQVQQLKNQGYDEATIRQAMSTGNSQMNMMDDHEREMFLAQLGISTPPYAK